MKIDNKGWGLNTMLVCVGIIVIALLSATFFSIRLNHMLGKENNESEKVIDNQVEVNYYINKKLNITSAADQYIKDNNIELSTMPTRIDIETLVAQNYINPVLDYKTNNRCMGYASMYLNDVNIKVINAFIRCDNYISDGYGGY